MSLEEERPEKLIPLTPRQRQVAKLINEGLTHDQIARRLGIALRTVQNHTWAIRQRQHLRGQVDIALFIERGGS